MITRRVKVQLLVFAVITALGISYVGVRYARLDRLVVDRSYTVIAHSERSGGIYVGAEVTYRGVHVGTVGRLVLTDTGVDIYLEIDDSWDRIPADATAVVGNRSAVGEQYVDLEPNVDDGPFLDDGASLTVVATPIATETLLGHLADTVGSVDRRALRTTVAELGTAFAGTGEDLQRILDTSSSFLDTADANFDVTTGLIRDSNTVLQGQIDSTSSLRMFADGLQAFSSSLAGADDDLRRVIDTGSFTARQLRGFLRDNESAIAELVTDAVTTGQIVVTHLPRLRMVLTIFPNVVSGAFTVVAKDPATGLYDVHAGLVLTPSNLCTHGYLDTETRGPQQRDDRPLPLDLGCTDPPTASNPRGAQNLSRAAPGGEPVAYLDPLRSGVGDDSWQLLYLRPLRAAQG